MATRLRATAILAALAIAGCDRPAATVTAATTAAGLAIIPLTIASANGAHAFSVEVARTAPQQERGLMYRTDLKPDRGMLFAPYPADGGPPRDANFWMKNTPSPLDIIYIRPDRTIARIAENTVPFSEAMIPSGEPVAAVLEIPGGRSANLGIAEDDKVGWTLPPAK